VEVGQQLFNDTLMQPVYSRLAKSLDYAQVHRRIADEYCGGAAVTKFPTK